MQVFLAITPQALRAPFFSCSLRGWGAFLGRCALVWGPQHKTRSPAMRVRAAVLITIAQQNICGGYMFKFSSISAILLALGSVSSTAHELQHHSHVTMRGNVITVACYRGPWDQVYWDRGLPAFYDSLTRAGYTPERAQAIADRVCRDQSLVGNPDALRREALRVISATPRR